MNKVKVATVTGLLAALVLGAACGANGNGTDGGTREVKINCYDPRTGELVKKDDDCHDDGLTAIKPLPSPLRTSGGMKTAAVPAPTKAPTKAAPKPRRS